MLSQSSNSMWKMAIFFKNVNLSRHLKLEIASAISALIDEK